MRLTTKGRFAVTAMLDLALNLLIENNKSVTLASISERQHISLSYLEQLFSKLRRQGLVKSRRGPGGGYLIVNPLHLISITSIIKAVDEPIDATYCKGNGNCTEAAILPDGHCITHKLWQTLNIKILDFLSSVTIQDLVDNVLTNTEIGGLKKNIEVNGISHSKSITTNELNHKNITKVESKSKSKSKTKLNKLITSKTPIINSIFNLGTVLENEENNYE